LKNSDGVHKQQATKQLSPLCCVFTVIGAVYNGQIVHPLRLAIEAWSSYVCFAVFIVSIVLAVVVIVVVFKIPANI
jgi:uncharacterized membrane protein YeaQ/YmgE (transglycosylase-associated protein family)